MLEQFGAGLRVAAPGIIKAFDSAKQTVVVQIAIRERINLNGNLSWEEISVLVDVPIFMPRAGEYILTMPVTIGDECLVIFGDNCMDAWWQSGGIQNQVDKRRHDLSDAFAFLGIWSQPKKISGYSTNSTQLRNLDGDTYVEIKDTVINIISAKDINISADADINITGGGQVVIGDATTIDDRVFMDHVHTGVEPGGGLTGGVN